MLVLILVNVSIKKQRCTLNNFIKEGTGLLTIMFFRNQYNYISKILYNNFRHDGSHWHILIKMPLPKLKLDFNFIILNATLQPKRRKEVVQVKKSYLDYCRELPLTKSKSVCPKNDSLKSARTLRLFSHIPKEK